MPSAEDEELHSLIQFQDGVVSFHEIDSRRTISVIFKSRKNGSDYRWALGCVDFRAEGKAQGGLGAGSKLGDKEAARHSYVTEEGPADQVIADVTSRMLAVVALLIQQGKDADARRAARKKRRP